MEESLTGRKTTRRAFLKTVGATSLVALAAPVLAACGQQAAPSPTAAPAAKPTEAPKAEPTKAPEVKATEPPKATEAPKVEATATPQAAEPTATPAPAQETPTPSTASGKLKEVPRNRTLMKVDFEATGKRTNWDIQNPWPPGSNHQNGQMHFLEPLAYYSAFADKEILWLAEAYEYTPDYKQLTIKTRKGVSWSDGVPFSARDVAFTYNMMKELGPKIRFGVDGQTYVESATAVDDNTVVVKFKVPAPRWFETATYKYDIGYYIAPEHIYSKVDPTTFKDSDFEAGQPVTTGPWKLAYTSPEQTIYDLREEEWWAVKAGLVKHKPEVWREIQVPVGSLQAAEQAIIANESDYCYPHIPQDVKAMIEANPKITSQSGQGPNYGYIDWWPLSVYVNCSRPPWDKKEARWAISYYLDRQKVIDVAYAGMTSLTYWIMPPYPALTPYIDNNLDLFEKYNTQEYNPAKGDALLEGLGWKKGPDGMWQDETGQPVGFEILGYEWMGLVGPTVTQMLVNAGIAAEWVMPPDAMNRFSTGDYTASLYGHGGSVRDIYASLALYIGANLAVPGLHQQNFPKWVNDEYDQVVNEVYLTPTENKEKLMELFRKAMEIWLPELPDIPLVVFYHNGGHNRTYWENWPIAPEGDVTGSKKGPNNYCNAASWHLTWPLILNELKAVEP